MNSFHQQLLADIIAASGKPTQHTFSDTYLGNSNPRYAINAPTLRKIAKTWTNANKSMTSGAFVKVVTSLIEGKSSTEKMLGGTLLDSANKTQQSFHPKIFDKWLDHLSGWAEVDVTCSGKFTIHSVSTHPAWPELLRKLSRSKNINKRRASLVLLCLPIRHHKDTWMAEVAIENIERLKSEKEVLISKAVSWLLRSMIKHHRKLVDQYIRKNATTLPAIAVRETRRKLETGRK